MANIAVIGTGYVGLVTGALLADFGHTVKCADIDAEKIDSLRNGAIPIFEPLLDEIVTKNHASGRLGFTTSIEEAVYLNDVVFIAVGTPSFEDGSADLRHVLGAAEEIAKHVNEYKVIVNKSTVPVGTGAKVKELIKTVLNNRGADCGFDIVSNPEFLREGSAVNDFLHPDRVVIGYENAKALNIMKDIYRVLYLNEVPFVETNIETAEMIKYATNAYLATKVAFINEVADICDVVGADVQQVAKAMGKDGRISPKFLNPGPGFGGSCFPKDTKGFAKLAEDNGVATDIVSAVIKSNETHKLRMVDKIAAGMGTLEGKRLAVLGVTFKPNTDDLREASSLTILPKLAKAGAILHIYDPQGKKEGLWRFAEFERSVTWFENEYDAIKGCDGIVILTEWNLFRNLDFEKIKSLTNGRRIFDLRNIYKRQDIEAAGFAYFGVGT
ncbi:MAG: UDP-glucose/GDP-mannose dehydrogenase family protein [Clostridiales bacterium]|nr:UDP-glucose/GDP-mannose dehydrogenase family protein [Clostridiales bacterium]